MPKNYDARNTARSGGKVNDTTKNQPKCRTCADTRTVRVSKTRSTPHNSPAKHQYYIVTEKCPDCK